MDEKIDSPRSKILNKSVKLGGYLEENYCNNLGFNHQPYNWLETTCDEMIEDRLGLLFFHYYNE